MTIKYQMKPISVALQRYHVIAAALAFWAPSSWGQEAPQTAIEEVVVIAQKVEQNIQDVPIAVSAMSGDTMQDLKIERGEELLRAVPNVNFSKNNFSTYNFSIRGVGTKAVSASSDPAVAVSFNNAPLIRNRLFEQEFFDVQRVEVLRGPQGTLYGRNATAGVVNMLPVMPQRDFAADIKVEAGNHKSKRVNGMINVPLGDTLAVRASGAMTKRDGFDLNTFTGKRVNDRDLFSTRLVLDWQPSDSFNANFIWQHFEEDDQRSRTGKQLCTPDPGPENPKSIYENTQLTQGCLPESLYSDKAYGTPNGSGYAFMLAPIIFLSYKYPVFKDLFANPYDGLTQSKDLREIATSYDPKFRAENDLFQFNFEWGLGDSLTFYSQSTYAKDDYYSTQDYNRYVSNDIFLDSTEYGMETGPTPGGVFMDPQLGPTTGILGADISRSDNKQLSQEIRLQSSFDGDFNFLLGANYLDFKTQDDYFVFNSMFNLIAQYGYNNTEDENGDLIPGNCLDPNGLSEGADCVYIDTNPLDQLDEEGHNYFLSRNIVETKSKAIFGEAYFDFTNDVKFTAGLRYTVDTKIATPVPSQLLLGSDYNTITEEIIPGPVSGGSFFRGYPASDKVTQEWKEFTGRAVLDWKAETPFTDETLFYVSLARGYKGGGSNPPRMDINPSVVQYQPLAEKFKPEYVNAIEFGTKNTLLGGSMQLNTTAFYYDYKDYQVSQIVDRISLNENFDAETMGFEVEGIWQFTDTTRFDLNLGFLKTELGGGAKSIDVMDRTQGNEDWVVVRPSIQVPSNCIAPKELADIVFGSNHPLEWFAAWSMCAGSQRYGSFNPDIETNFPYNLIFGYEYNPATDAPNGGKGFYADLEGNELPNAPNFTANFGIEHVVPVRAWDLKLRADYYYQSESYGRVYNTEFDRLKAWSNVNVSVTATNPQSDLQLQLYVKNLFDDAPITDFFVNSDDTGLSANVFTLEPRIVGLSLYKGF